MTRFLPQTLALAILLAWAMPSPAADSCSADWFCVRTVDGADGGVSFIGENLRPFPVTISLRVRSRNLAATGPNPVTLTIPGNGERVAIEMRPVNAQRSTWYRYNFAWMVGSLDPAHDDQYLYAFPYAPGKRYGVLQGYGSRFSHTGLERYTVDFNMPEGTPVHAAREGIVARVVEEHDRGCWDDGCGKFANFVVVQHADGTTGEYYHLQKNGALVNEGDVVKRGQRIALSGNTGHTTMPHLHFGVYRAAAWGASESIPVRFRGSDGVVTTPRRGRGYYAD